MRERIDCCESIRSLRLCSPMDYASFLFAGRSGYVIFSFSFCLALAFALRYDRPSFSRYSVVFIFHFLFGIFPHSLLYENTVTSQSSVFPEDILFGDPLLPLLCTRSSMINGSFFLCTLLLGTSMEDVLLFFPLFSFVKFNISPASTFVNTFFHIF